jgi:phosphohistidine phosphatase
MKSLLLVRHAKSSWDNPDLNDHDRPLNSRGERDAPFMAKIIRKLKIEPEQILSSPAKRTLVTAQIFSKEFKYPVSKIIQDDDIYLANSNQLLKKIRKTDDKIKTLMVVGHNPGITSLSNYLSGKFIDNIPTSGVVILKSKIKSWNYIDRKVCTLERFEYPRKYK